MNKFIIYTDGASRGNPGPGGYASIILEDKKVREIGGGEKGTTNNRMEMMAAIEGLRQTPENSEIVVHTDSTYLLNGVTKWIFGWQKNGWKTKSKQDVLNKDLWEELVEEAEKRKVKWSHVKSHAENKPNNRADAIATRFADGKEVKLYNGPEENYFFK